MRKTILLLLSAALVTAPAPAAFADIPVIDDDVKKKRAEDEGHSKQDTETQTDQLEEQSVTNCNISQKEKNRRLYRSPAQAVKEDAKNVERIGRLPSFEELFAAQTVPDVLASFDSLESA